MSRFCSSPTSNMLRVKYSEDARERRNQRKNRASWCCFSVVSAAFLIQQAKKAPHNRELCGVYPSRRSGVVKPGLEQVWLDQRQNPSRRSGVVKPGPNHPTQSCAGHPSRRSGVVKPGRRRPPASSLFYPSRRSGVVKPGHIAHVMAITANPSRRSGVVKPGPKCEWANEMNILAEEAAWSNPDWKRLR